MSIRVRVRKGDTELEVAGAREDLGSAVSALKETMAELSTLLAGTGSATTISVAAPAKLSSESSRVIEDEVPSIGKTNSGSEAIVKLLSTKWGETPRGIGELRSALEANAMPIPTTTISGLLNYLAKSGRVKRWKTETGYVYRILEAQS